MFQVGLPCNLGLSGTELRPVNFNKRPQNEEVFSRKIHGAHVSPMFAVFYTGNIVSSDSFCFQDANYACGTQQGALNTERAYKWKLSGSARQSEIWIPCVYWLIHSGVSYSREIWIFSEWEGSYRSFLDFFVSEKQLRHSWKGKQIVGAVRK